MRVIGGVLVVCGVFGVLAGCIPTSFEARAPWRHDAEEKCLAAGAVKESPSVALLKPIQGPGMCGADFPLKVGALGESAVQTASLGYADELRPPGSVPQGSQFPPASNSYPRGSYPTPPAPVSSAPLPPQQGYAAPNYAPQTYTPPPTMTQRDSYDARASQSYSQQPMSLEPNGARQSYTPSDTYRPAPDNYPREPDEQEDVQANGPENYQVNRSRDGAPYTTSPAQSPRLEPSRIPLGPARAPVAATAAVTPAATLACPIVSALDRWIIDAVQPAAQRWFNSAVVEIKQISAYSCRGMNGQPGAHISEHAFGNALDIAGFVFADGRKVTVEKGWHGTAEEQAFLHDVQLAACDQFTTVLAPGSNVYHYNHIHVDLMRRASGRRICQPRAMSGEEVAARVRGKNGPMLAQQEQRGEPRYGQQPSYERNTREQPFERDSDPFAWRGANKNGRDNGTTGSISQKSRAELKQVIDDEEFLGDDGDPDEHVLAPPRVAAPETTVTGSVTPRAITPFVDVTKPY